MFRVGLTGGIASGKSTVSQYFKELGIKVIDTDEISRHLMEPGQYAYQQTVKHFGDYILKPDKSLNRERLREQVFNHPAEKKWLEEMIHPLIKQEAEKALGTVQSDYALLVVPLMYESGFDQLVDHVIAIDCPASVQKKRLMERDHISEPLAEKMIHSQMRNDRRHALANTVLYNGENKDLKVKIRLLHHHLKRLAKRFQ
ncbi:MAG: dephospho-CoA kinase [Gammaproteobacteria bacterium]|nr:dephospho-CoA kinase [Gammaproteobacteria bacterium]